MKDKLVTAAAIALAALAAAQASEVALSLSSPDDYYYFTIPTNMSASIEGRGMVSNETTGTVPLRYEDIAFLKEAKLERIYFEEWTNLFKNVDSVKENYANREEIDYWRVEDVLSFFDVSPDYLKPEAQAFTNGIAAYNPGDDMSLSNASECIFSASYPSMFFTKKDEPPWLATFGHGSPLRFSDIRECYEYIGKLSRPFLKEKMITSLDGQFLEESSESDNLSGLISRYDALKKAWVYHEDFSTNMVSTVKYNQAFSKRIKFEATRKKSVGRDSGKVVTDVVPSSGTETITSLTTANSFPIIDLTNKIANLKGRTAESVTMFVVGTIGIVEQTFGAPDTSDDRYFIARVDANTAARNALGAVVYETGGKDFVEDIFDRASRLVYGASGLPYKSADDLLQVVPNPPDPTGEDDIHADTTITKTFQFFISFNYAYVLYNDIKFNARVLEDGESPE